MLSNLMIQLLKLLHSQSCAAVKVDKYLFLSITCPFTVLHYKRWWTVIILSATVC